MSRLKWPAAGAALILGILIFISGQQIWWSAKIADTQVTETLTGMQVRPSFMLTAALALLLFLAIALFGAVLRIIIALALLVVSSADVYALINLDESDFLARLNTAGSSTINQLVNIPGANAWLTATLIALVAVIVLTILTLSNAKSWPKASFKKYDREADPTDAWKALDQGLDPTV